MLELRLRKSHGTAFQDFLGDFLGRIYPGDFVAVRAQGSLGDGGMDGYLNSTDTLYQCYGARNGAVADVKTVCRKMVEDFHTARLTTPRMRRWMFTHNLLDMPRQMVDTIDEIRVIAAEHGIQTGFFNIDMFRNLLPRLSEDDLEDLIGIRVFNDADRERLPQTVSDIFSGIVAAMDQRLPDRTEIGEVPLDKLDYNSIPTRWRNNFTLFYSYSPIVTNILSAYPEEAATETVPAFLRSEYKKLKAQDNDAGSILKHLHESLAGYVNESDGRYEASMAILATMFESCIIFEDKKDIQTQELVDDPA
ncbi:ABC-three component system protein [Rhizobium phaseoli]|uniref:ABC-three component system protein n=1 Tax=Rhizobium phaseoli TaxID=396 RepID=UPI00255743E3|nr:ABC-three component system protein [Rhizobium phaseoli]MDK4724934.1 hypothetical protein [Rhizobium phaseoli]